MTENKTVVKKFIVYANHRLKDFAKAFLFDIGIVCDKKKRKLCVRNKKCAKYPAYQQAFTDCRKLTVIVRGKLNGEDL